MNLKRMIIRRRAEMAKKYGDPCAMEPGTFESILKAFRKIDPDKTTVLKIADKISKKLSTP